MPSASAARSSANSTSSRLSPPTRQVPPANFRSRAIPPARPSPRRLAAEIYGLKMVRENIEDESHNTTRFVILSRHAAGCRAGRPAGDHQLCLPCTECSGGALQGHGRLRHQRREHDQARILSARGPVLGDPVLCRHRGPPGRAQRPPGPGGARVLLSYLRVLGVYKAAPLRAEIARRMEMPQSS